MYPLLRANLCSYATSIAYMVRAIGPIRFPRKRKLSVDTKRRLLLLLISSVFTLSVFVLASISAFRFEAMPKGRISKTGVIEVTTTKRGFMNLSVETKVAIAVATSFVVLMMGAMAQG